MGDPINRVNLLYTINSTARRKVSVFDVVLALVAVDLVH